MAERMMHMSQRFTFTARRSSLFRGQPARTEILGRFCNVFHSLEVRQLLVNTLTAGLVIPPDVVHLPHDDDMFDLMEVEVGSSQGHHQVTETN